jgi:hypothetical protein
MTVITWTILLILPKGANPADTISLIETTNQCQVQTSEKIDQTRLAAVSKKISSNQKILYNKYADYWILTLTDARAVTNVENERNSPIMHDSDLVDDPFLVEDTLVLEGE